MQPFALKRIKVFCFFFSKKKRFLPIAFAALYLANLTHHTPWRDELLAWMIARTANTPLDLFRALHVDGHPGLWHALLMPVTRFTADPLAMKAVHGAIGLALIGRGCPARC